MKPCKTLLRHYGSLKMSKPIRSEAYIDKFHWYTNMEKSGDIGRLWLYLTCKHPPSIEEQEIITYKEVIRIHKAKIGNPYKSFYTRSLDGQFHFAHE